MPSVFISYSRSDKDFVARLHDALVAREYQVWVDWEDIPPSAEWFAEIRAGVDGADGFIYVISPDSAESKVCAQELEHAMAQHKRVIPVVRRDPDGAHVPDAAAALNWIFLRERDDFGTGVTQLVGALEQDLDHVRTHTRLGVEANRWEQSGRERSQLLRGAELSAAEAWLVAGADKEPEPTQLQREYVLAGRRSATRRQRTVIGAVTAALVVAAVLAIVALIQRSHAIHERNVAFARQLDADAQSQYPTDPELSVLLAVHAAQVNPGSATEEALRAALAQSQVRIRYPLEAPQGDALWNPAGTRLLVTSPGTGGWARIYTPGTDRQPVPLGSGPSHPGQSGWDARGDRVVIGGSQPAVYDTTTGRLIAHVPGAAILVALSADGTRVVTVSPDSIGHVFDVASGRQLASFRPRYHGGTTCLALSPDDAVVAQCDLQSLSAPTSPADLDTWSTRTGALVHSIHNPLLIGSVAFSPDSSRYVFTVPNTLASIAHLSVAAQARAEGRDGTFVYETISGRRVIAFPGAASTAAFSPFKQVPELAYATVGDDLAHVYSFASHLSHALTGATDTINAVHFDPFGVDVVTASDDNSARVYNGFTGGPPIEVLAGSASAVENAGFGHDDMKVATAATDGTVRVWAGPKPQPSATLAPAVLSPQADAFTTSIGFTAGSARIVQASQTGQGQVLDAHTLKVLARFEAPSGEGFAGAQPTRDGATIAALSGPLTENHALRYIAGGELYNAESGRLVATIAPTGEGGLINGALDYQGDKLVTLGANGSADEWDTRTGKLLHHLTGTLPGQAAAFSRDGSQLAIARRPVLPPPAETSATFGPITIDLYNARTGVRERTIVGRPLTPQVPGGRMFAPLTLAFNPAGSLLAVSGADQGVEIYDPATGQLAHEELGVEGAPGGSFVESLGFSPNGKFLAAGAASGAYVWRIPSYTHLTTFQHVPSNLAIYVGPGLGVQVGFSADSNYLVTSGDGALNTWDLADHLQLFHSDPVARGGLSPNGAQTVTALGVGVELYPCDLCGGLDHLLALAKRNTTRQLTPSERATYLKQG